MATASPTCSAHMLLVAACLILQSGCRSDGPDGASQVADGPAFRNLSSSVEFVGDQACFQCHETEYMGFQDHGMAHSFYELTAGTAVESFGSEVVVDSVNGYRYRTFEENGTYLMEEFLLGEDGERTHSLVREMDYVVGSGTIAKTYITEENGWYYELPITWYTNAGRWDFSPGYEVSNKRFGRKIADRCMACHNSYPEPVLQTNGAYENVPFGIGCERCHGAGQLHVEERLSSPEPSGDMDPTIVNSAHLSVDRQLDVCQQCHLSGDVSVLRTGRTAYDYRPAEKLEDYIGLFSTHKEDVEGSVEVISHADRMKKSACFTESLRSSSPLLCTTCHDPHEGFRSAGDDYFNSTCQDCHSPEQLSEQFAGTSAFATHSATANCVDCHMPSADVQEAPHSTFTDHWIRVVGRDGTPTAGPTPMPARGRGPQQGQTTLSAYYARDQEGALGRMYKGMATITLGRQESNVDYLREGIRLIDEASAEGQQSGEATYLKGFALQLLGEYAASVIPLEEAVRDEPSRAERLNALAQTYERLRIKPEATAELYKQALAIQPMLTDIRLNYGRFLEATGRLDAAIEQYRRAATDEPFNELARYNLGTAYIRRGDLDQAEAWLNEALKLDPLYVSAISNLGLVEATRGNLARARTLFERGVEIDPNNFEALDNLGTYHLNEDNESLAVAYLGRAFAARPDAVATSSKYALALFRAGDFERAGEQARITLERAPDDATARQILNALE